MLAGMCPRLVLHWNISWNIFSRSDILDVAKAGIEFYQHQKELEVDPRVQLLCL